MIITTATEDLLAAAIEFFEFDGITIENSGADIYIDNPNDPLEGRRKVTTEEETTVRTRADEIAITRNQTAFINAVKQEVQKRVFAIASSNTQMNMTAARADGDLTPDQLTAYHDGRVWIAAMQSKAGELIVAGDTNYADDSKWPVCPQNVIDLTNIF